MRGSYCIHEASQIANKASGYVTCLPMFVLLVVTMSLLGCPSHNPSLPGYVTDALNRESSMGHGEARLSVTVTQRGSLNAAQSLGPEGELDGVLELRIRWTDHELHGHHDDQPGDQCVTARFHIDLIDESGASVRTIVSDGKWIQTGDGRVWESEFLALGTMFASDWQEFREFRPLMWPYDLFLRHLFPLTRTKGLSRRAWRKRVRVESIIEDIQPENGKTLATARMVVWSPGIPFNPKPSFPRIVASFSPSESNMLTHLKVMKEGLGPLGIATSYDTPIALDSGVLIPKVCTHVFPRDEGSIVLESVLTCLRSDIGSYRAEVMSSRAPSTDFAVTVTDAVRQILFRPPAKTITLPGGGTITAEYVDSPPDSN